jgi:hypothetical protein
VKPLIVLLLLVGILGIIFGMYTLLRPPDNPPTPTAQSTQTPEPVKSTPPSPSVHVIKVDPSKLWDDTGISVSANTTLHLSATGTLNWDKTLPDVGPKGASWTPQTLPQPNDFPLPSAHCAALLMKVGDKIYEIGDGETVTVPNAGNIKFAVNDRVNYLSDNVGEFEVIIRRK